MINTKEGLTKIDIKGQIYVKLNTINLNIRYTGRHFLLINELEELYAIFKLYKENLIRNAHDKVYVFTISCITILVYLW